MHLFAKSSIAAACLLVGASCATDGMRSASADGRGEQCFMPRAGATFRSVDRETVDVQLGRNRVYRLSLGAGCFDVDWARAVNLRSRSGTFICSASDAELIVPSSIGPSRCIVNDLRRLSEAEIRARPRG